MVFQLEWIEKRNHRLISYVNYNTYWNDTSYYSALYTLYLPCHPMGRREIPTETTTGGGIEWIYNVEWCNAFECVDNVSLWFLFFNISTEVSTRQVTPKTFYEWWLTSIQLSCLLWDTRKAIMAKWVLFIELFSICDQLINRLYHLIWISDGSINIRSIFFLIWT